MRIKQFFASESIAFTNDFYAKTYGLELVNETNYRQTEPCLFCGMYRKGDVVRILNHRGPRMILWGGQDTEHTSTIELMALLHDTVHISQSHWIDTALRKYGIEPRFVALPHTDIDYWQPCPKGDKVYCYAPNEVYNRFLAEEVAKLIPYEVILTDGPRQYSQEEVRELYKQSFVGLRLRQFDGISATVQQMGLMGRKTIWNGKTPSAIGWDKISDIIKAIHAEKQVVGDEERISTDVYNYLCKDDSWLNI